MLYSVCKQSKPKLFEYHHTCRKLGSWSRGDQVLWSHLLDPGAIRVDSGAIRVDSGAIRVDPGAIRGSYKAIKNRLEVKVILNGIIYR